MDGSVLHCTERVKMYRSVLCCKESVKLDRSLLSWI